MPKYISLLGTPALGSTLLSSISQLSHHLRPLPPPAVGRTMIRLFGCLSDPIGYLAEAPIPVDACLFAACGPRSQCFSLRRVRAVMLRHEGDALVGSSLGRGAGRRTWSQDRGNCLPSVRRICSAVMRCRLKWRLLGGYQASGRRLGYASPSRALPCHFRSHIRPVVKRMGCRYGH